MRAFNDERNRYVRYDVNRGQEACRNTGIDLARGKYIAFLDSDNEWMPTKLEKQMALFKRLPASVGVVYSGFCFESKGELFSPFIPNIRGHVYERMLRGCFMISIVPLVRKECFEKVGLFDTSMKRGTDWDLWIRMAEHYDFDLVPEVLAKYHLHGDQLSNDLEARITAWNKMLEKYSLVLIDRPNISAVWLRRIGILHGISGAVSVSRKYLLQSVRKCPWLLGNYAIVFLSFFPFYGRLLKSRLTQNRNGFYLYH